MKVILLKDVLKVGNKDDVKEFADGYAQNVLIAKGLAIRATPHELSKLQDKLKKLQATKEEENKLFKDLVVSLNKKTLQIKAKANDKGHLFSAVKKGEIATLIKEHTGVDIAEDAIVFPKPIKEIGPHSVTIKKGERSGTFTIQVL